MTNPLDQPTKDHLSADPAVRTAAIAREEAVLEAWPPADDQLTQIKRGVALANIGQAQFRSRRMQDAIEHFDDSERCLASVSGLEKLRANSLNTRAAALLWLKRHREARDTATRTIQLSKQVDIPELLQSAWATRSLASVALGDWPEASYAADQLLALVGSDSLPSVRPLATQALVNKARAAQALGDREAGLAAAEQAISQARQTGKDSDESLCDAMMVRAQLLHDVGDVPAAIAAFDEVIETFRDSPEDYALQARNIARVLRVRRKTGARVKGVFKKRGRQN